MSPSLAATSGLALDGQATGASPAHGELLELGWAPLAGPASAPTSRLVRPLAAAEVPARIQRLTGIATGDLRRALHPRRAWSELAAAAEALAPGPVCPAVVHFARFEEPFLRALHRTWGPGRPFPLELVCTHELARRLLPTLPRKGLRAVAGYFGHDIPELKRSRDHVAATVLVWRELARLLEEREGVGDLPALREWLRAGPGPAARGRGRVYPMDPALRRDLPDRPGVYRMRRASGDLLYVGKARSLRRRVGSYFRERARHPERTLEMLTQARRLEYSETATALEAALVEADDIKRLAPRYNVALREGGRRLAFWSEDLRGSAPRPDRRHRLGPFPSPESLARLAALVRWLEGDDPALGAAALGVPAPYAPVAEVLRRGLEAFRDRHRLPRPLGPRELLHLGVRLQRQRRRGEDAGDETGAAEPAAEERGHPWSPERVADSCEETAAEGARLVRRARWLCQLAESSLAWSEDGRRWLLVLSGGCPVRHEPLADDAPVPPPPGHARSAAQRRRLIDLRAYDRLSVLTRELKALVATDAPVAVRLGPRRRLGRAALAGRLSRV